MATRGKSARSKGTSYERAVAIKFREMGWPECETSRFASKKMDDMKVDLVETHPFYVQCKAVENLGPPHNVLAEMPDKGSKGIINIVFHKKNRKGTIVAMSEEDFWKLVRMANLPHDQEG
jgi:hypothetical protein